MTLSPGLLVASSDHPTAPHADHAAPANAAAAARRSVRTWWVAAALAVGAWAGTAALQPAHAGNVAWSIGLQTPGAVVHLANAPQPYVVVRPPVYAVAPPVVVYDPWARPAPVYQPYYAPPAPRHSGWSGHRGQWKEQHGRWQGHGGHGHGQPRYQSQQRGWDQRR